MEKWGIWFGIMVLAGIALACRPPQLPPGGRWVPNEGCTQGPFYPKPPSNTGERCSCWVYCGYICRPWKGSPCANGGVWINPKGQRCHCYTTNGQSFYICEATTTTTGTTTPTSTTTPTTTT